MDIETLDQFLGLGARLRRIAASVGDMQLDRTSGQLAILNFPFW